jgi:hypothetical protein
MSKAQLQFLLVILKKLEQGGKSHPHQHRLGSILNAHNSLMVKKLRNQQVPIEKTLKPWPSIIDGPATTVHSATAQAEG